MMMYQSILGLLLGLSLKSVVAVPLAQQNIQGQAQGQQGSDGLLGFSPITPFPPANYKITREPHQLKIPAGQAVWSYYGVAEQIWRTISFSFSTDVDYQYSTGYEVHAFPINSNSPGSITVARFAINALADLLETSRKNPGGESWDVYDQLIERTDTAPPVPWFRFVPNAVLDVTSSTPADAAANEVSLANTDVKVIPTDVKIIPEPGLPLPQLSVKISKLQPDRPIDARVFVLLLSLSLTKLPWAHAAEQKIKLGGFGPGQSFRQYPQAQGASILIESLADYAGTPDEITFLHISYALRQLALYSANNNYYGGFTSEWRVRDLPSFLRITVARPQGDEGLTWIKEVTQGEASQFDQIAGTAFSTEDPGAAAAAISPQ